MQYRVAALAYDDDAGLHFLCGMNDLFCGAPDGNLSFEFDLSFHSTLSHWPETAFKTVPLFVEHRVELGALGRLQWTNDR